MEISFKSSIHNYTLCINENAIIFGKNDLFKKKMLNEFEHALTKCNDFVRIDGQKFEKNEYEVIVISEDNDFESEFKFTKNNSLKQLIYADIVAKLNEEKIINYTNEIFDAIDEKINGLIDKKINKNNNSNLSLKIEIPDVNSIIDKFTNIYIDDVLLSESSIPKAKKRLLLYELYLYDIKKIKNSKNIIVIIENFDVYLNSQETIYFLKKVSSISDDNCHFILTSSNNILEFINVDKFTIYTTFNKLISLTFLDIGIKNYLINSQITNEENEFMNVEALISNDEINNIKQRIFNLRPDVISKMLNNYDIKFVLKKPKNIECTYILCSNLKELELFKEIYKVLIENSI